jgi:hypothetical protein
MVAGGFSSVKVIGFGRLMTGTGMILSSGFWIVTCEKDTISVVMGGNVMVRSLVVVGFGVMVVSSVNLNGGKTMIQGGLHVTTGDVVSQIRGAVIVEKLTLFVRLTSMVVLGPGSSEDGA